MCARARLPAASLLTFRVFRLRRLIRRFAFIVTRVFRLFRLFRLFCHLLVEVFPDVNTENVTERSHLRNARLLLTQLRVAFHEETSYSSRLGLC